MNSSLIKRILINKGIQNDNYIKENKKINRSYITPSFSNINKILKKDKDKMNLENINLFSYLDKNSYKKKVYNNLKTNNVKRKEYYHPYFNLFENNDLFFKNKLIRQRNKNQDIQINIIRHEVPINNSLKIKNYEHNDNDYYIIKDSKDNDEYDKDKIRNIIEIQTKSNFNNKYKLMFKSSNIKKRNTISNYFSLIKRNLKKNFKTVNLPKTNIIMNQENSVNKKVFENINNISVPKSKRKIISIPILINSKLRKKINKEKSEKYKFHNSTKFDLEINDTFCFYSTKNPLFQTEINYKSKYNSNN